jgi:peroxiredoxin
MIKIGQEAPNFSLVDTEKKTKQLTDYKGKNVVLLFFPFAFTGVCTAELCATRDDIASYNNTNAEVLAISVDSPFTLAKFKEDQKLNFSLLSDFNKIASKDYDVLYESFAVGLLGVSKRSAFVIDKQGIVKYAEVLESAGDLPNFDAIKNCLKELN